MEAYLENMSAGGGLIETMEEMQLVTTDLKDSLLMLIDLSCDREDEPVLNLSAMCGMYRLLASAANIISCKLEYCIEQAHKQKKGAA